MTPEDVFFDIWCKSFVEGRDPLWVEPTASLSVLAGLSSKGLLVSGAVNGQDDLVWKLTPKGELVGAAMNQEIFRF